MASYTPNSPTGKAAFELRSRILRSGDYGEPTGKAGAVVIVSRSGINISQASVRDMAIFEADTFAGVPAPEADRIPGVRGHSYASSATAAFGLLQGLIELDKRRIQVRDGDCVRVLVEDGYFKLRDMVEGPMFCMNNPFTVLWWTPVALWKYDDHERQREMFGRHRAVTSDTFLRTTGQGEKAVLDSIHGKLSVEFGSAYGMGKKAEDACMKVTPGYSPGGVTVPLLYVPGQIKDPRQLFIKLVESWVKNPAWSAAMHQVGMSPREAYKNSSLRLEDVASMVAQPINHFNVGTEGWIVVGEPANTPAAEKMHLHDAFDNEATLMLE